jgi:uncharacterized membrane protein HdeD (DUF308 family)
LASLYQRSWWSLLIRGLIALIFGILAIAWPEGVLKFLVTILGLFVLAVGLVATIGALMHRKESDKWLVILIPGLIGVVIGIIAITAPAAVAAIIAYLIAIWALVHGISGIYNAMKLRKDIQGEWMPILIGIVWVVFGIALVIRPLAAGTVITWLVGLFAMILGVLWLILAIRARKWQRPSGV